MCVCFYHFCVYLQVSFAHFNLLKILAMDKSESPGKGSQVLVWSILTIERILGRHLHNSHGTKKQPPSINDPDPYITVGIGHLCFHAVLFGWWTFTRSKGLILVSSVHSTCWISHGAHDVFWDGTMSFQKSVVLKEVFNSWLWNLTTIKLCISKYSLFTSFNIILTVWGNWMLMCPIHANFQLILL